MSSTRRKFIKDSSALAGIGLSGMVSAPYIARALTSSPNEKIVVGLIGARSMGFGDLQSALRLPNVECAALCDIDQNVLDKRTKEVEEHQGKRPDQYKDFRKLLERKDIDAVIIGTPDHWHCLTMVYACEAGKDVYVEKPLGNTLGECDVMVEAARRYNRVVQVGQQQRSGRHWQQARDFIQSGKIGQLRKVQVWCNFNYGVGGPKAPDGPVPEGVDFDLWLGPAPKRNFNPSRFHGNWRMFWDYGGGLTTDWGVHLLDMALWVKNIKKPPLSVMATGGRWAFPDRAHETFDTMSVNYQMEDYTITWESTAGTEKGPYNRNYGLAYIGNDATLVIDRNGGELIPEKERQSIPNSDLDLKGKDYHFEHMKNFIECIKSRETPNCSVEEGSLVAKYAHMANLSLKTQSLLQWNEKTNDFGANHEANQLIYPHYRKPWELPDLTKLRS